MGLIKVLMLKLFADILFLFRAIYYSGYLFILLVSKDLF